MNFFSHLFSYYYLNYYHNTFSRLLVNNVFQVIFLYGNNSSRFRGIKQQDRLVYNDNFNVLQTPTKLASLQQLKDVVVLLLFGLVCIRFVSFEKDIAYCSMIILMSLKWCYWISHALSIAISLVAFGSQTCKF